MGNLRIAHNYFTSGDYMNKDTLTTFDHIIVGGGASGLFCAVILGKNLKNSTIAILESSDRVGKKLMVTGNGKCNLTNLNLSSEMYHGSFRYCAEKLTDSCSPEFIRSIFSDLGLCTTVTPSGLVYPMSRQANSVVDLLRLSCNNHDVKTFTGTKVTDISKRKGKYILKTTKGEYACSKLIIATGGKSSPSTGADVSIFESLKKLGHTVTPLCPSLCPVKVKSPYIKSLKGIRSNAKVTILINGKESKSEVGEVQFTDNALSGICIFNLSRIANTAENAVISLNLAENMNDEELELFLTHKIANMNQNCTAEEWLIGLFSKMLNFALLKEAGISPQEKIGTIDSVRIKMLCRVITDFRFEVIPHRDFSRSQVTAGGISGREIDAESLESKLHKGLYIIGEATDCDGDCGGANLQYAFATGYTAAMDIAK